MVEGGTDKENKCIGQCQMPLLAGQGRKCVTG